MKRFAGSTMLWRLLRRLRSRCALMRAVTRFVTSPDPPLTRDQVKLMKRDNMVEGNTSTLEDLGIGPASVEEILPTYIHPSHRNRAS